MANIIELFDKAKQNLKWPKYTYYVENTKIQFSLAGPNAKFPGTLNITDGGTYGNNKFFGRVRRIGDQAVVDWKLNEHKELIQRLVDNPVEEGKLFGQQFAYCCFCSTEITSKPSLKVGYGPVCAEKWGLPWGETEENLENL